MRHLSVRVDGNVENQISRLSIGADEVTNSSAFGLREGGGTGVSLSASILIVVSCNLGNIFKFAAILEN
jgi:hypothetical protein